MGWKPFKGHTWEGYREPRGPCVAAHSLLLDPGVLGRERKSVQVLREEQTVYTWLCAAEHTWCLSVPNCARE